jgi:hypothetical protein
MAIRYSFFSDNLATSSADLRDSKPEDVTPLKFPHTDKSVTKPSWVNVGEHLNSLEEIRPDSDVDGGWHTSGHQNNWTGRAADVAEENSRNTRLSLGQDSNYDPVSFAFKPFALIRTLDPRLWSQAQGNKSIEVRLDV